jgi:hypothetical protein
MKAIHGFVAVVVAVASIGTAPAGAWASEQLFSQLPDGQSTYGPSESWAPAGINSEIADDFEATGNIDRVFASGFIRASYAEPFTPVLIEEDSGRREFARVVPASDLWRLPGPDDASVSGMFTLQAVI